jgi:hypothetical protein
MRSLHSTDKDGVINEVTGPFQFNEEYIFFKILLITVNARRLYQQS